MKRHTRPIIAVVLAVVMMLAGATAVLAWGPGMGRGGLGTQAQDAIAEKLGLTADELAAKLQAGEKLADIAEEQGVSLQVLKDAADAARQEAVKAAIEQAVTDGTLTREQGDWMLQGIDNGYGRGYSPWGVGRGGFMGRRGFGLGPGDDGRERPDPADTRGDYGNFKISSGGAGGQRSLLGWPRRFNRQAFGRDAFASAGNFGNLRQGHR